MTSPGLLPIPFNAAPPVMPDAGMGMGFPSSMMMADEPFAKKQRMDVTDGLIHKSLCSESSENHISVTLWLITLCG